MYQIIVKWRILYRYLDNHRPRPSLLCVCAIPLDENGWKMPQVVGLVGGKQWCFGLYSHQISESVRWHIFRDKLTVKMLKCLIIMSKN